MTHQTRRRSRIRRAAILGVGLALAAATTAYTPAPVASADSTLPAGFTDASWVSGMSRPYQMEFAPDGRLFVSQQGGQLRVIKDGTLLATPFVSVTADSNGDRGLIGIAFDPDFPANHYVYVYYTASTPASHNRVSRFTASGDVAVPGSERVLIDMENLGSSTLHNGGSIDFGADGMLYITVGDNVQGVVAQSMTSLLGKVLRLNPDGSIPADNPFYSTTTGKYRSIWALGLRNPYTAGIQPGTGRFLINDVGAMTWEEIDEGEAGANYGWPTTEGATSDPRFKGPLYAYHHGTTATTGCAIVGGTFYNPAVNGFPSSYAGQYFFADACQGWIRMLDPATGTPSAFLTGGVGVVDTKVGPDGALYYLSRTGGAGNPGIVRRIQYSGAPVISTQPLDQTVAPGVPATFSVTAAGATPLSYQWQRDGIDVAGATTTSYTLADPTLADDGARFAVVVTNPRGSVASNDATLTVTTNAAPNAIIVAPADGAHYGGGDTIQFRGTADDAEDGTLPPSAFAYEIVFHHNTHTHPGPPIGPGTTGDARSGSFVVPDIGETSTDVFYRIILTVTDSGGRATQTYVDVLPNISNLTVAATPTSSGDGLQITLDGQPHITPYSEASVVGMKRTLGAPSPQTLDATTYEFSSWSDGGTATHVVSTPGTDTTYTAAFSPSTADTMKPSVSVNAPAAGASVSGVVDLGAAASDNVGVTQVRWYVDNALTAVDTDGAPWARPWSSLSVADGAHRVFAKARDAAGNWGTSKNITFTVANSPPPTIDTTITGGPTVTNDTTPMFTFTANIGGSTFACSLDGSGFASCTSPVTLPPLASGEHTFAVAATDPSGNTDSSPATRSFVVDTTKPAVVLTAPANGAAVSGTVNLRATATDANGTTNAKWYVDSVQVAIDADGEPWSRSWDSTSVTNGTHRIVAKVRDSAGNWGTSASASVTVAN